MKKFLKISWFTDAISLVATVFLFAFAAHSQVAVVNSHPLQNKVSFINPSPLHHIWRDGVSMTGKISMPPGYNVNQWDIINYETRDTVATGNTQFVNATMDFVSVANCNTYDLVFQISNGVRTFDFAYPGEITVLPPVPTTFDQTINTAGDKNGTWTNRAGQKILVTGSVSRINMYWWKSDDPTNPVHIVLKNLDIQTSTNIVSLGFTAMRNVIVDGCTEENVRYGAIAQKLTGAASQIFQWMGAEPSDNTKTSYNTIVCGIEADGNDIVGAGITAFRILNNRDAANNESTYTYTRATWLNLYGHNTYEETFYTGQSSDYTSTWRYPYYQNVLYYNIIGENGGNEVFQHGLHRNTSIFRCRFSNGGTRNQNSHENLVQWSNGNRDNYFFMNYLDQGTHNLLGFFTGETGRNNYFWSCVAYTAGKDADGGGNFWGRADTGSIETTVNYVVEHWTFVWTAGVAGFTLYEPYTLDFDKFYSVSNIVNGATTTNYENASGVDAAHVTFSNYVTLTANIANIKFRDAANKNYHLSTLSSPAYGSYTASNNTHVYKDYDVEGAKFVSGYSVAGAYSGYELLTLKP